LSRIGQYIKSKTPKHWRMIHNEECGHAAEKLSWTKYTKWEIH